MSLRAMVQVFDHSDARLSDRLVLLVLADHAHDDGSNAFPSVTTIAAKARISERAVFDSLKALEAAGEIERAGKTSRGVTIWRLALSPAESAPELVKDGSSKRSDAGSAPPTASSAGSTASPAGHRCPRPHCGIQAKSARLLAEHDYVVHDGPLPAHYQEDA
jgi:hypothetical protein